MPLIPNFAMLGSGPAVLLLHDADTDHLAFAPQVELLASQGWRAIAWDMPGYHGNPPPYGGYSLAALATTADQLLEMLKIPHAHVVGHGLGAMVAAEMAQRHPMRVRSLTLLAGGPALGESECTHWIEARQQLLAQSLQQASTEHAQMQHFAEQLVQLQAGELALPEGLQLVRHAITQIQPLAYRRMLDLLQGQPYTTTRWQQSLQPALLISGAQDICMPPAAMQAMADGMAQARHHSLPGVGHWPQLESPDAVESLLLDFLSERQMALH